MKALKLFTMALFLSIAVIAWINASSVQAVSVGEDAAATFKAKCATCHAADGSGNTPAGKAMKVRNLGSAEVQAQTDDQLFETIAKGKGKMPGYEKSLGADACKAQVAHIRTFKK